MAYDLLKRLWKKVLNSRIVGPYTLKMIQDSLKSPSPNHPDSQPVTKSDVIYGYRFLLNRFPESEQVVTNKVNSGITFIEFRSALQNSVEFGSLFKRNTEHDAEYNIFNYTSAFRPFLWVLKYKQSEANDIVKQIYANISFDEPIKLCNFISKVISHDSPPPVLLDIGANVGAFSFIFSTAGWKVFGIEGSHDNSESLRLTAKINDFDFTLGEFVVSDKTGSIYFFQNGPWGYASHKKPDSTFDKMPSFCLDDYKQTSLTSIEKIDFLKMDIEGSEPAAVRGGKKFLEQFGFPPVFCEVNIFTLFLTNSSKEDLFLEFSSIGYIPFIFDNKKLYKYDHRIFRNEIVTDYLFIHESDNRFDQYKRDDFNESKNDRVIIKTIMDSLYVKDVTLLIAACINVSTSKFGEIPEIKNRVQEIKALPQYIAAIEQFKKNTT